MRLPIGAITARPGWGKNGARQPPKPSPGIERRYGRSTWRCLLCWPQLHGTRVFGGFLLSRSALSTHSRSMVEADEHGLCRWNIAVHMPEPLEFPLRCKHCGGAVQPHHLVKQCPECGVTLNASQLCRYRGRTRRPDAQRRKLPPSLPLAPTGWLRTRHRHLDILISPPQFPVQSHYKPALN